MSVMVVATAAFGDETADRRAARRARVERLIKIEQRIEATRPYRRDAPLRELTVTNVEVEEIQAAMATVTPDPIIHIFGVVRGCPCEDSSACTDQVWMVAQGPKASRSLLLSKLGNDWAIGPVQRWWLKYEALLARSPRRFGFPTPNLNAEDALKFSFPACLGKQ